MKKMEAKIEKRITEFAHYVEKRLSQIEAILEEHAAQESNRVPVIPDESTMTSDLANKKQACTKQEIIKEVREEFQRGVGNSFNAFGEMMEIRFTAIENHIGLSLEELGGNDNEKT